MAAKVHRLVSKPERPKQEQAALLRAALLPFEHDPRDQVRDLVVRIDRRTAAQNGLTFIMIPAEQDRAAVRWFRANSRRPMQAMALWAELSTAVDRDTGEVMLTRDQLAGLVNASADHVSETMGELEWFGATIPRRERVSRIRGPGRAHYFVKPFVGTHVAGGACAAQAKAAFGPLRVTEGSRRA